MNYETLQLQVSSQTTCLALLMQNSCHKTLCFIITKSKSIYWQGKKYLLSEKRSSSILIRECQCNKFPVITFLLILLIKLQSTEACSKNNFSGYTDVRMSAQHTDTRQTESYHMQRIWHLSSSSRALLNRMHSLNTMIDRWSFHR
jgi:hypothetical protein